MSEQVPAQFKIGWTGSSVLMSCQRPDCDWWEPVNHIPLTEVVALAREHVEETHRG